MNFNIQIGQLAEYIEEFKDIQLQHNEEVDIRDLGCQIDTPSGLTAINYIIKKENLSGIKITLETGLMDKMEIKCAEKHILRKDNKDIFAEDIVLGDKLETKYGQYPVSKMEPISDTTYYDIGIDAPHLYYDSDGVLHHNTLMTAALSHKCEKYGRTVVIVPNKSLVTQTEEDYINMELDVGVYYGDRKDLNKMHTICTWQSLGNMMKKSKAKEAEIDIQDFLEDVIAVIVDETHQAKAQVLKDLLTGPFAHIPIRWGLTGTVPKEDMDRVSLLCSIGPVTNQVSAKELQDKGVLAECHVNIIQMIDYKEYNNYQAELKYLLTDSDRQDYIGNLILEVNKTGNTLILVDRVQAGKSLVQKINDYVGKDQAVFISGAVKNKDRKEHYDEVKELNDKIICATYGVASVGINIPRIFNLVLLEPGKSFVRVIQSIGRGIRKAEDKDFVQIWDITSTCKFAKRHLTQRKKFYRSAEYPFTIVKEDWQ